ncbi:hypothetical protein B296_00020560, partial [Ensete ventricosum]
MLHRRIGTLSDLYVSGKTRTARYIPVWQLTGTWTGRYRAVPLRSAVGGRFPPSAVDLGENDRRRSIEEEKGKKKKRKRRRSTSHRPSGDSTRGSPAAVAARAALALVRGDVAGRRCPRCPSDVNADFFLPTQERVRGD